MSQLGRPFKTCLGSTSSLKFISLSKASSVMIFIPCNLSRAYSSSLMSHLRSSVETVCQKIPFSYKSRSPILKYGIIVSNQVIKMSPKIHIVVTAMNPTSKGQAGGAHPSDEKTDCTRCQLYFGSFYHEIGVRKSFESSCLELAIQQPNPKQKHGAHFMMLKTFCESLSS